MNPIDKAGGENSKEQIIPQEEDLTRKLPTEILEIILSGKSNQEKEITALVNRYWNRKTTDTAAKQEFSKIVDFVKFLAENLKGDSFSNERKKLLDVIEDKRIFDSVSLIEVKYSTEHLSENLINVLKDLLDEDLERLKDLSKNEIQLKNIFDLAEIYKDIDKAKLETNENKRNQLYDDIYSELRCYKTLNNIKNVSQVPDEIKDRSNLEIVKEISETDVDKAIEVANRISDEKVYGDAIWICSNRLMGNGDFDRAIEIANTVADQEKKEEIFKYISFRLTKVSDKLIKEDVDKVLEMTKKINTNETDQDKEMVIWNCFAALVNKGMIDQAIEVAKNRMLNLQNKEQAFIMLAHKLSEGNVDKSIEVASMMPDAVGKNFILCSLCVNLLKSNKDNDFNKIADLLDKAKKIANAISDLNTKEAVYAIISWNEKVINLARSLEPEIDSIKLRSILDKFLLDNFEPSIEIVKQVADEETQDILLDYFETVKKTFYF